MRIVKTSSLIGTGFLSAHVNRRVSGAPTIIPYSESGVDMYSILKKSDLAPGDLLFKWVLPESHLSGKVIAASQKATVRVRMKKSSQHYRSNYGIDPTRFSHVALIYRDFDILEYDEGSGILEIVKCKGEGCVKAPSDAGFRHGHKYLVIRSNNPRLTYHAVANMTTIYTHWKNKRTSSYGMRKLVTSGVFYKKSAPICDKKISEVLAKIRGEKHSWFHTNRANFFCSYFATFVYLWAANDLMRNNPSLKDPVWLLGTDDSRITPVELAARLLESEYFDIVGEFAP